MPFRRSKEKETLRVLEVGTKEKEARRVLEVGKQVSVTVRTRQNVIYIIRRTLHARVVACLTVCFRLLRILIELAGIADTRADRGHVGRVDVLLLQPVPGHLGEPGVVHNVLAAAVEVAEPLGEVRRDELLQQVVGVGVDVWRVLDPRLEDVFVDLHGRAAVPEGREAAQHLEDEDAEGPPELLALHVLSDILLTSPPTCCSPSTQLLQAPGSRACRTASR
jgi:hypothetical protein